MTTGRINQVTTFQPEGGTRAAGAARPSPPDTAPGGGRGEFTLAGAIKRPATTTHRGRTAGPSRPFQLPPLSSPGTVRSQGTRRGARTGAHRLRHRPLGRRATPRGHAGERRLPRTASPLESARRCWPEANDLQTPSVPGAQGPRTSATPASRAAGGRTPLTPAARKGIRGHRS